MALRSSLVASLSTRGAAASAAAVLMVGGGVAVAQSGTLSTDADEPVIEELDDAPAEDSEPAETPPADDTPGNDPAPTEIPVADDDDLTIVEESEDEPAAEDGGSEDGGSEDAEEFSAWVESLDGDELGCLKGQLVSHFARQGPTAFSAGDGDFGSVGDIAAFLEAEGRGLPGRCAERILGGETEGADSEQDPEDAEVEGSSTGPGQGADAGKPAHAGTPGPPDHAGTPGPPDHAGAPQGAGPPEHVTSRNNGTGPGNSGSAPGRADEGNGDG